MTIHPDLARLDARYRQLHADVVAGVISVEDAYVAIDALTVVDGAGTLWGIDDTGRFYRRDPDGDPIIEDPSRFVPAQLPMRAGADGTAPWHQSAPTTMPTEAPRRTLPVEVPIPSPRHLDDAEPSSSWRDRLPSRNTRLIVAVAAAVAALLYIAIFVRDDAPPAAVISTTTSTSTTVPVAGGGAVSAERSQAVIAGITSGERDVAASVVEDAGSAATIATQTAALDGFSSDELTVAAGPAELSTDASSATQRWDLVQQPGATVWASATVTWVLDGNGEWVLAAWPQFTPVG